MYHDDDDKDDNDADDSNSIDDDDDDGNDDDDCDLPVELLGAGRQGQVCCWAAHTLNYRDGDG